MAKLPPIPRTLLRVFCGAVLSCGAFASPRVLADNDAAVCVVVEDVLLDMRRFLAGRNPLEVDRFDGPHARRDVMEAVLVQRILHAGGWPHGVVYLPVQSYERTLHALAVGGADLTAASIWLQDIEGQSDKLIASEPLIRDGEFVAGVYTLPENRHVLSATNLVTLRELRAVSSTAWKPDWQVLGALGFREPHHAPRWENMPRMLKAGRADFLLAPLQPTPDFSMEVEGIRLVPVPGIKIALPGSRHFGLSRLSGDKDKLEAALARGIARLQESGTLRRAYEECGFLDPRTRDWTLIRPPGPGEEPAP